MNSKNWNHFVQLFAIAGVLALGQTSASAAIVPGATPGSFSVSDTGAATYSIPIQVPPGINGMQPQLALTYSSQAGDGIAGVGWSISGMSSITRCPATIAHDGAGNNHGVQYDNTDKFCLNGKRLRLDSGTYGSANAVYHFEIDDFTKITQNGSGPTSFTVQTADGMTLEYGAESSARLAVSSVNSRWMINNIKDSSTNQNTIHYTYSESDGVLYLDSIEYSGDATRTVEFDYENRATDDQITRYFGGSSYTQKKRLKTIRTEVSGATVKAYNLVYESVVSGRTNRTRLDSVQECDASSDCYTATTFDWEYGSDGLETEVGNQDDGSSTGDSIAIDVNGDGLGDLVYPDGTTWDILHGAETGGFGSHYNTTASSTNKEYTQSIDYNSDGLRDLVVATPSGNWKILQSTGTNFTEIDTGVVNNNAEDYYSVADYDGDGLEDIVMVRSNSNGVWAHRNTGGAFAAEALISVLEPDENFGPQAQMATSNVKSGGAPDFNGDLKSDILYLFTKTITPDCGGEPGCSETPYDVDYWGAQLSDGASNLTVAKADIFDVPHFGDYNGDGLTDIAMLRLSPVGWYIKFGTGTGFNQVVTTVTDSSSKIFPFDYDADGMTDLMYSNGSTWYVIRSDGNTFEPAVSTGISGGANDSVFRLADTNGDGQTDLVFADLSTSKWKVAVHSGVRRDQVTKFTDGLGNYAEPTYALPTDSNVYVAGTGASFPNFDYIGSKSLVKSYLTNNGIGGTSTVSYFYKGWKINVQGLGALGFSEVRESLPNDVVAARHFNQSHPTIGMVTRSTLEEREGGNDKNEIGSALLSETDFTVTHHTVASTPTDNDRYINYLSGITSKRYDLDGAGSSGTPLTTDTVTIVAMDFNVGLPTNIDRTITDINSNTFTIDTDNIYQSNKSSAWCVGIPSEIKTTMTVDGVTEERRRTASNNLTACRADSETAETTDGTLEQTTNYFYDTYGNIDQIDATAVGSTQTRTTTLNYSLESGYFPRTITNSLNQTLTVTWDKDFGQPLTVTDPNSLVVTHLYDDFGRATRVTYPDGVQIDSTLVSCGSGCIDLTSTESDGVTNGLQAFTRFDQLGRPTRQGQIMFDGTTSYAHTEYDSLGRVDRVSNPTTNASTGSAWSSFEYDDLGRTKKETRPGSVSNRVTTVSYSNLSTTVTLPVSSHTRVFDYDGLGQVEQVTETGTGSSSSTDTATTTYGYGPFGTLRSVSPPGVSTTTIDHNKRGWKKEIIDPDTGTTKYDYNGFGELLTLTQGFGTSDVVTSDFEYDELGRLERRVDNAENKESEWTYDDAPGAGIGQPSTVSMGPISGTSDYFRSYDYNTTGQLTSTLYAFESEQFIVDQTYNSLGRLATLTYPDSMPPTGMPDQISTSEPTSEDGSYTISWTDGGGSVTSYEIGEFDNSSGTWSADVDVGMSLSKAYSGQSEDTYKYRVKSCSGTMCSAYMEGADTTVAFPPNTVPSISTSESQSPDGSFTISWTTPTSGTVTKYWLSERVNGSWSSDTDQGLNLSKAYTGKTDGDYDYRVKSCNGSSCADYTIGAATDVALTPGLVGSISTNDPSSTDGQYTITWSAASGTVTNYWLSERVNGGAWGADIDRGTNLSKWYTGKGNGSYEYRVKACNDWSCTAYKTGALTAVTLPPGSVGSISTNDPNSTDGQYTITWTAASGTVTNYWLSERVNGGAWGANINRGTNTGKSYSGKGNGSYEYRVKACNGSACSGYTTGALTTVTLPPGTPASITIPSSDTDGNYTISWGAATGTVTAYKLYEATNASFTGQTEVYSGTGLSKAITKSNTQSGTYYYRVKAYNGSQGSGYRTGGNSIVVTIAPSVPPSISRNPGWLTQGGNYTISWGASTGTVTQYQLQRATNVSFSGATTVYQGTALSRLFNNAQIGSWYFRVRACNTTSVCSNYKQYAKVTVVSGGGGGGPIPWAKLELIEVDEVDEPVLASAKRQPNAVMAQRGITTTRTTALRLTPEQQLERELKIQDLAAQFGVSNTPGNPRREWVVQQVDARLSQAPTAGSGGGGSGAGDRLKIEYAYQNGYLKDIRDADNNQTAIWEATQINQYGQITEADLGNGVTTGYSFDANTGELKTIQSGKTGVSDIQDLSYQWDDLGNLTQRKDDNISKTEDFQYDGLNRLHKAHLNSSQVLQMTYDPNGNIKSKTGTGTYDTSSSYNYTSNTHKLSSISGVSASFTYDARGNMKTGMGRTITYSSYNKPTFIDGGSNESTFKYGPERARYFHQRKSGSNISTILYAGGLFQKVTRADSVVEFRHAIQANGQEVATLIRRDDFDHEMLYHHRDHLGSVTTITDESGTVVEELSFDAFGKRRDAADWLSDLTSTIREDLNEQYDRGYTGHEQLDNLELVHMNGRVYDPSIGRFLSADPIVQAPFNSQSHNRFSYVWNNPMSLTDPSGYSGIGADFVSMLNGGGGGGFADEDPYQPYGERCMECGSSDDRDANGSAMGTLGGPPHHSGSYEPERDDKDPFANRRSPHNPGAGTPPAVRKDPNVSTEHVANGTQATSAARQGVDYLDAQGGNSGSPVIGRNADSESSAQVADAAFYDERNFFDESATGQGILTTVVMPELPEGAAESGTDVFAIVNPTFAHVQPRIVGLHLTTPAFRHIKAGHSSDSLAKRKGKFDPIILNKRTPQKHFSRILGIALNSGTVTGIVPYKASEGGFRLFILAPGPVGVTSKGNPTNTIAIGIAPLGNGVWAIVTAFPWLPAADDLPGK